MIMAIFLITKIIKLWKQQQQKSKNISETVLYIYILYGF